MGGKNEDLKQAVQELVNSTREFHKKLPDVIISHGNAQFKRGEEHRTSSPETMKLIGHINEKVVEIGTNQKNMIKSQEKMCETVEKFTNKIEKEIDGIKEICVKKEDLTKTLVDYPKTSYLEQHFLKKTEGVTKVENQPMKRIFWKLIDYVVIAVLASVLVMSGINLG